MSNTKEILDVNYGGAFPSPHDPRNYIHENSYDKVTLIEPVKEILYKNTDILHQRKIGKCTASAIIQLVNKKHKKKFSDDFQYLLQKKFYDKNWEEGSSLAAGCFIGKNYGFLPIDNFPSITDAEPGITYPQYVEKLKQITDEEINRLIAISKKYRLKGYAVVDESSKEAVAKALSDSEVGLYCRYEVTPDWYTDEKGIVTWDFARISPLRNNGRVLSGHAIGATGYNYTTPDRVYRLTNTWGATYGDTGSVYANHSVVAMKEARILYFDSVPENVQPKDFTYTFRKDLRYSQVYNREVEYLQTFLKLRGFFSESPNGYYGNKTAEAVQAYQRSKGMRFTTGRIVGVTTRYFINKDLQQNIQTMGEQNITKKWYTSRTLFVAMIQGVLGVIAVISADPNTPQQYVGAIAILKTILDMYLRFLTTEKIG